MIAGEFVIVRGTTSAAISNTVQYVHCTVLQIGTSYWEYHRAAISNTVQYSTYTVLYFKLDHACLLTIVHGTISSAAISNVVQ
jgi:hypothetical protein